MIALPKNEADRRLWSSRLGSGLLYGTFGLLMFGPLAYGSVEPWSIFTMEAGAAVLALLWIAKQAFDGQINIKWNPLFFPMGGFAFLIIAQLGFGKTAYRHDTVAGGLLYCAYGTLCFLSGQTLLRTLHARRIAVMF